MSVGKEESTGTFIDDLVSKRDRKKWHQNSQILDYKLLKIYKSDWFNFHQCQYYRKKAIIAATKLKIFTLFGTGLDCDIIRDSLVKRGWIEKFSPKYLRHLQLRTIEALLPNVEPNNDIERTIMSKMTDKFVPNFQWNSPICLRYKCLTGLPYSNRIIRERSLDFTNVNGLHKCVTKIQKYKIDGYEYVHIPKLHSVNVKEDYMEFLKSYRITYCLSLIGFISNEHDTRGIFHELGTIPVSIIRFAIEVIRAKMTYAINSDLNTITQFLCSEEFGDKEWANFYDNVNNLVGGKLKLKEMINSESQKYLHECRSLIVQATQHWPLLPWIGCNNLWILKPINVSTNTNGIVIKQNYVDMVNYVQRRVDKKFVLQKYIEKPFLIYKTKFDIHQHIMLTVTNTKFSIWMYQDCYLEFCDLEYDLNSLTKLCHIPNVQNSKKKQENSNRNPKLPACNMWTVKQFRQYLYLGGSDDVWYNKIYHGMKKTVIAIILAGLDKNRFIPKTFELFKCNFILSETFMPILMNIDSSPDMTPSTLIQENLFPDILEDLVKVVIDLPQNKRASTGQFELIYEYDSLHMCAITL